MWYRADVARLLQVLGALTGCLGVCAMGCFTDPVNERPTVSIDPLPDPPHRSVVLSFHATAHDDQSEPLQFAWGAADTASACADGDPLPGTPSQVGPKNTFMTSFDTAGWHCVFVTVTDSFNASSSAVMALRIDDLPPKAVILQVVPGTGALVQPPANFPLYSNLRFTASGSSDTDTHVPLKNVSWTLARPSAPMAGLQDPCDMSTTDFCLSQPEPGPYTLTLTVTDGDGMTDTATQMFTVATDQPPCIQLTDPSWDVPLPENPDSPLTLNVTSVIDDGDPLPVPNGQMPMGSFTWSWRKATMGSFTGLFTFQALNPGPSFEFPGGMFQLLDMVQVRVEANDRMKTRPAPVQCTADDLVCDDVSAPPGCHRWVTWNVVFRL
jgi:hypothetical protein